MTASTTEVMTDAGWDAPICRQNVETALSIPPRARNVTMELRTTSADTANANRTADATSIVGTAFYRTNLKNVTKAHPMG